MCTASIRAVRISKTLVSFYETTRRSNPEDSQLQLALGLLLEISNYVRFFFPVFLESEEGMLHSTLHSRWSSGITLKLAEIMFMFVTVRWLRNGGQAYRPGGFLSLFFRLIKSTSRYTIADNELICVYGLF